MKRKAGADLETASKIQTLSPETAPSAESRGMSLLDLAEVLDQHKIWAESGGGSGGKADLSGVDVAKVDLTGVNLQGAQLNKANLRGADLSLANLRGASLVQAELRDTNLVGTELRGANLMGATLYGAEGLWVGRLGGTNLFDAMLPEAVATFDGAKAIAQATRFSRWIYFLILAACALCAVVIAFTTDVHLVLNSSAIPFSREGDRGGVQHQVHVRGEGDDHRAQRARRQNQEIDPAGKPGCLRDGLGAIERGHRLRQHGVEQIRPAEAPHPQTFRAIQRRTHQVRAAQLRAKQVGIAEVGLHQRCAAKIAQGKISAAKIPLIQKRAFQLASRQIRERQVDAAQIRLGAGLAARFHPNLVLIQNFGEIKQGNPARFICRRNFGGRRLNFR